MPKADVIVDVSFLQFGKNAPKNSGFKGIVNQSSLFGGFTSYTGRESATENSIENDNPGGETPPDLSEQSGSFAGYTSRDSATSGSADSGYFTMTNEGKLYTAEERKQWIEKSKNAFSKPGDLAWTIVVSLENYDLLKQYDIKDQNDLSRIAQVSLYKSFRKIGFDPANMIWWEDYHTNTKHPHMHITFLEKENKRTRGKLTAKEVKDLKTSFITELAARKEYQRRFHQKADLALKEVTPLRQEVVSAAERLDYTSIKKIYALYQQLPSTGRLQYGSTMMIPYRAQLDDIADEILKSPDVKEAYGKFTETIHSFSLNINDIGGASVSDFEKAQDNKLRKQIANSVLQGFKTWKESSGNLYSNSTSWTGKKAAKVLSSITENEFKSAALSENEQGFVIALVEGKYDIAAELLSTIDDKTVNGKYLKGAYLYLSGSVDADKEKGIRLMHESAEEGNRAARHFINYRKAGYGMNKHTYHKIQKIVAPKLVRSARSACREQMHDIEEEINKFLYDNKKAVVKDNAYEDVEQERAIQENRKGVDY